jgi:hypothetical protein
MEQPWSLVVSHGRKQLDQGLRSVDERLGLLHEHRERLAAVLDELHTKIEGVCAVRDGLAAARTDLVEGPVPTELAELGTRTVGLGLALKRQEALPSCDECAAVFANNLAWLATPKRKRQDDGEVRQSQLGPKYFIHRTAPPQRSPRPPLSSNLHPFPTMTVTATTHPPSARNQ